MINQHEQPSEKVRSGCSGLVGTYINNMQQHTSTLFFVQRKTVSCKFDKCGIKKYDSSLDIAFIILMPSLQKLHKMNA
jgi:hypothetical protein